MDNDPEITPTPSVDFFDILPALLIGVCVGLIPGAIIGGLAAMRGVEAAVHQSNEEVQATAEQIDACSAQLKEDVGLMRSCTERLNSLPKNDELVNGLRSCTESLEKATVHVNTVSAKCDGVVQSLEDDADKFAEDAELIRQYGELLPRESALHLAMVDHLNQFGLPNLSFEADGLEWDGESQLLMNNCAYSGDDECTPMAMQVTVFDNGAFTLGHPEPLEQ